MDIARARSTAITGPSGSGKSTLMHCPADQQQESPAEDGQEKARRTLT